MAIYSCSHSTVGRSTHAAGTAGAHARYVAREGAARLVVGEHMPLGRETARSWLDGQETADRKNARVIDKLMLALPRELDEAERAQLVRDFAAEVGKGRIPWMAGIHDRGEDAGNPHAHVIFRDRDRETGKRVAGLSEKGSTERLREAWERMANQALERAGSDERIDRRSLAAQGIAREAGIHVGPNVLAMEERGIRPTSRPKMTLDGRVIDWPKIDQGRTRLDRQAEIEAANDNPEGERDREGKGEGGKGMPAPVDPPAPERPAPATSTADRPPEALPPPLTAPPEPVKADAPAREPEAPVRPSQEAQRPKPVHTLPPAAADRAAGVSRLRRAIDRARSRLDALSSRLDAAFDRLRARFHGQDRQRDQVEPPRPAELDAYRRRPARPEPERGILDEYRRRQGRDHTGPER